MILNGFSALMQQKQFTKITVNDIAAAAFINRSTFYVHFTDKYELLETVFQGVLDQDAIDTSTLYEHPFRMLAQIKESSLKNMIQYQAHDTEFVSAFFDFFVERLIDQRTEISELVSASSSAWSTQFRDGSNGLTRSLISLPIMIS